MRHHESHPAIAEVAEAIEEQNTFAIRGEIRHGEEIAAR
jgi:hypothetical protein